MSPRNKITFNLAIIYVMMFAIAALAMGSIVSVQRLNNERWQNLSVWLNDNTKTIDAHRGNILSDDGNIIATSVPGYYVRIDLAADGVKRVFSNEKDSLALRLSLMFRDKPASVYRKNLEEAYKKGSLGFMLTPRKIDYNELQQIKNFPILRRGTYGGGRIIEQENQRVLPMGKLAARTIGTLNRGAQGGEYGYAGNTGLEAAYESHLKGKPGVGYRQNLSGRWVNRIEIEPSNGLDILTHIDVRYQDIVQSALERQLKMSNAEWGTVILMEVKTGAIKAIANLGRVSPGYYDEIYNYAIGHAGNYEPGSTFKLISLMVALEHGVVDTSDVFDTGRGVWQYKGRNIVDSDYQYGGHGEMTVRGIFEKSSNVGFAKMITTHYEQNPRRFVDQLHFMGVNKPLGIELQGEGVPYFKYPGDKDWWGTTLAWMSYGYETKMTPLQTLAFYNAVANDGKMMKPQLVREIQDRGDAVERFRPEIIHPAIASRETIRKAQSLLAAVCETGTGRSIQSQHFKTAGKTGTAQIASGTGGYARGLYLASFAGYFPAQDPVYSMIVVVNKPQGAFYGGVVAGPVFKEVAEKVHAIYTLGESLPETNHQTAAVPAIKTGRTQDILKVLRAFDLDTRGRKPDAYVAKANGDSTGISLVPVEINNTQIPDVRGMAPADAVYLLEQAGLFVRISGVGRVRNQSIPPGGKIQHGQTITLILG